MAQHFAKCPDETALPAVKTCVCDKNLDGLLQYQYIYTFECIYVNQLYLNVHVYIKGEYIKHICTCVHRQSYTSTSTKSIEI